MLHPPCTACARQRSDHIVSFDSVARTKERYPHSLERVFYGVRREVIKQKTRSEQTCMKRDAKMNELFRKVVTSRRIITVQFPPRSSSSSGRDAYPNEITMRDSTSRVASPQTHAAKTIITPCQDAPAQAMAQSPVHPAPEGDLTALLEKLGWTDGIHTMTDAIAP